MPRPVRSATFSSGKYRISFARIDGLCDPPSDSAEITIDYRLRGRALMETLLHESAHAECPDLPEETVLNLARNQARLLWRLGYRAKKRKAG